MKTIALPRLISLVIVGAFVGGGARALRAEENVLSQLALEFTDHYEHQRFAECRNSLAQLEQHDADFARLAEFEFKLGRLLYEADPAHRAWAKEHLSKFLAGEKHARAPEAAEACLFLGRATADEGDWKAAADILISVSADAPSLRVALRAARSLSDVAKLSGDAELGSAAEAGLTVAMVQFADSPGRPDAVRFLSVLREDSDHSDPAARLHSLGSAHFRLARHFDRLREYPKSRVHWQEVDRVFTDLLDDYPLPDPNATDHVEIERALRMRHRLGMANYSLGRFETCSILMAEVYSYFGHPALAETNFAIGALTWKTASDTVLSRVNRNLEPILEVLVSGKAGNGFIAWGFRTLASEAGLRGEAELEFLYLRDLVECLKLPTGSKVRPEIAIAPSVGKLRAVERRSPHLRAQLEGRRSPAFEAMAEAGLVLQTPDGDPVFMSWDRDAPYSS